MFATPPARLRPQDAAAGAPGRGEADGWRPRSLRCLIPGLPRPPACLHPRPQPRAGRPEAAAIGRPLPLETSAGEEGARGERPGPQGHFRRRRGVDASGALTLPPPTPGYHGLLAASPPPDRHLSANACPGVSHGLVLLKHSFFKKTKCLFIWLCCRDGRAVTHPQGYRELDQDGPIKI